MIASNLNSNFVTPVYPPVVPGINIPDQELISPKNLINYENETRFVSALKLWFLNKSYSIHNSKSYMEYHIPLSALAPDFVKIDNNGNPYIYRDNRDFRYPVCDLSVKIRFRTTSFELGLYAQVGLYESALEQSPGLLNQYKTFNSNPSAHDLRIGECHYGKNFKLPENKLPRNAFDDWYFDVYNTKYVEAFESLQLLYKGIWSQITPLFQHNRSTSISNKTGESNTLFWSAKLTYPELVHGKVFTKFWTKRLVEMGVISDTSVVTCPTHDSY